jgi:hypothetical protein
LLKIYSASEVSLIFALIPIEGGKGEDEFIQIAKQGENFMYKEGIDGEGTRSASKSNYFTVKVTLMQSSTANAILSAILLGDIALPGGAGVAPIMIRDKQGLSIFASTSAWIMKWPDLKYGKEVGQVEWEFGVHDPTVFIGGN